MSEERVYDLSFSRTLAREKGKIKHGSRKSTRFELYGAYQFSQRLDGRNFPTNLPALKSERGEFYSTMYRLRVNGKWYGGRGYIFFTLEEIFLLMMKGGEAI